MRVLHMGYNAIHSLDQDLFEHLTFLTELSLKYNPISVLDQSTVLAISSLDYLKVQLWSNLKSQILVCGQMLRRTLVTC
jgi:hypothetical protein